MVEKHISILNFIEKLKLEVNFNLFTIVDYWDGDLCAIGLMKDKKLIYISTFNYLKSEEPMYYFELELIDESDIHNINVVKVGEAISEDKLKDEIKQFFDV